MANRITLFLLAVCLCIVFAACGEDSSPSAISPSTEASFGTPISNRIEVHAESDQDGHDHSHLEPAQVTAEMGVALVPSELVVGPNRFAVGLFDADGQVVDQAEVHFHYYDLSNPQTPVLESHAEATRLQTPDGLTTIFTHEREFLHAGEWGVEVQARFPNGTAALKRIGFEVIAESMAPIPGEEAPLVETLTSGDVNNDLSLLTSAPVPNPAFYQQSLSEALTSGKPTVLLFATPAFCQTRFCGPAYEQTSALQERYGDQINFVHVEVYSGLPNPSATNWQMAPAMVEFGLNTEPWLYVIDRKGMVVYRVEGMFGTAEIEHYLSTLL
jgi:hypothetical protein